MRVAFVGAGAIALQCIERLIVEYQGKHQIVAAVVSDDIQSFLKQSVEGVLAFPVLTINNTKRNETELIRLLSDTRPDILISVQYPWILSKAVITLMKGFILNLHNALLPEYRGHHSLSYEILNNESSHTCILHWIAEVVDRGTLQSSRTIAIQPDDTAYSLWMRSCQSCVELFSTFLAEASEPQWQPTRIPIEGEGNYYARKNIDAAKRIPDHASMETISRYARAFYYPPHEPAYFIHEGIRHYVLPEHYKYVAQNEVTLKTPIPKRHT